MKALQLKQILVLSLGVLLSATSILENCVTATELPSDSEKRDAAETVQPAAVPTPVAKPIGLDPVQLGRSLDQGDIVGGVQQIELGWKRQFENYYQGKLTSRLRDVDQITQVLEKNYRKTDQKAALIYVVPAVSHLELVLIAPGGSPVHRRVVAANREALTATTKDFRNEVTNSTTTEAAYLPSAQTLYQWVIAPLEPDLKARGINTLIFCLGKGLRSLPLAALHDGQQFLVEKYSLAIIPAFNLLDTRVTKLQNVQVLAMGASEFKDKSTLPGVPLEL